jgi:hypothetical protein
MHFQVVNIKSDTESVPYYRFHHVEIGKNILSPNTMLKFVPHLRDLDDEEETQYFSWLRELESMDDQCGFKTMNPTEKTAKTRRDEFATTVQVYLDRWIQTLAIDGCTKSTLIRYMATSTSEDDDAITPQQKTNLLDSHGEDAGSPRARTAAKMFTEAFDRVFGERVTLRDILMRDESVETIVDNKRVKDTPSSQKTRDEELLLSVEKFLGTYAVLGCLICFSHDCEHGDFDVHNNRRCFSMDNVGRFGPLLKRKLAEQARDHTEVDETPSSQAPQLCKNQCYRSYDVGNPAAPVEPWTEKEIDVLKATFAVLAGGSNVQPQCATASLLGRKCWDVYRQLKALRLSLPPVEPAPEVIKAKPLPWYDRNRKVLLGDWQECTVVHEYARREVVDPCHHDGPCSAANKCPCVTHKLLCERFCQCTAESCAYKFTGCACHSQGKTCHQRQKEGKPCICVQLNRECDPALCKGCGAAERADPRNGYDEMLHSTGCQNVSLQRNTGKTVLMGKSQLEGCGYGLFTAEDIAQDEFVIEYRGELIYHDEGVRRERRRGDVFDEKNNCSYLFTLLEQEGIWVDAAIYGNLSRYINHASEGDKRGCNVTPKILYVNGEYRIRFAALRDIKAGEELFFNYGENFPNLTKKLLEDKEAEENGEVGSAVKRKSGRPAGRGVARKTTNKALNGKAEPGPKRGRGKAYAAPLQDDDAMDWQAEPAEDDGAWARSQPGHQGKQTRRGRAVTKRVRAKMAEKDDDEAEDDEDDTDGLRRSRTRPGRASAGSFRKYAAGLEYEESLGGDVDTPPPKPKAPVVKRASKRGGARPGAGRKPKHPKPVVPAAPVESEKPGAPDVSAGPPPAMPAAPSELEVTPRRRGRPRKRKLSELDSDGEADYSAVQADVSGLAMGDEDDEYDEYDDDDVVDRSSRKRRKPMRYRAEDNGP